MQIELSDAERHTLRMVLEDFLPELRREVSRTEAIAFRHELVKREELCERLLDLLRQAQV